MTFKQIQYALVTAQCGSLSEASKRLYVAQPSISEAIQNLENELGITIFIRGHAGIMITPEGEEFLKTVQGIMDQMEYVQRIYGRGKEHMPHFSASAIHYYFTSTAFTRLVEEVTGDGPDGYNLRLLDTTTQNVLGEVSKGISEIGVLGYVEENKNFLLREMRNRSLEYTELASMTPHAFFSKRHPLAHKDSLVVEDLKPYPCAEFFQGQGTSNLFAEESIRLGDWKRTVQIQDCGTVTVLLRATDAFSVGCGIIPEYIRHEDVCSIPITDAERTTILWVKRKGHQLSALGSRFLALCQMEIDAG